MTNLEYLGKVIETDVLVIGGGLSGLWAANRAKQFVDSVVVVDKGPRTGYAGQGYFSGGGIQALPPGEDVDEYVRDIIYLGDGLYEQDLLEKIFNQSWDRIEDYQRLGVKFITDKDGKLKYIPQRGLKHNACYLGEPFGSGGESMMTVLAKEANRLGVKYLNRIYITDLVKRNGTVIGAVGFHARAGTFYIFKAGAVILATGACCLKGPYEDTAMSCGEGIDLAFKAGAELKNLEFMTIWVIPKKFRWEGVTYLLPLGAKFVNEKAETFMDRYSPVLKSNCDYNYLTRVMAIEAREGRGPFYLDCSGMTPENKELMRPAGGWSELQYGKLLESGIRPFEERQEWMPGFNWVSGVHTDLDMRTTVPGLFIAGVLRNVDPGIYFGGWSICKCAAFGYWAGENAAKYAESRESLQIDEGEARKLKGDMYAPLGKAGIDPEEALTEIQRTIFRYDVCILKTEANLKRALSKIEKIKDELLPQMGAKDVHYLMKLREVRSMTLVAELSLRASLMRTETRASHYREDYPSRDDENWLKYIMVSRRDGKLIFRTEPLPLDRYKHKVTRYYMDNFMFPR